MLDWIKGRLHLQLGSIPKSAPLLVILEKEEICLRKYCIHVNQGRLSHKLVYDNKGSSDYDLCKD